MKIKYNILSSILFIFFLIFLISNWLQQENFLLKTLLILILASFIYGLIKILAEVKNPHLNLKTNLFTILTTSLSALATWFLNHTLNINIVIAASLIGLIGYFISHISDTQMFETLPVHAYCGSFVGMSSILVLHSWELTFTSGILCGILFILTRDVYEGVGGKLGAIACLSVSITVLFLNLINNIISWIY